MTHTLRNTIASLGLALATGAQAADTSVEATAGAINARWNQALNSGNAKALAALYAENATLSPGNGKVLVGRAQIEQLFQGFIDNGVHNHAIEIVQVSGDDAQLFQVARWSANGAEQGGSKPAFGGILLSVLRKDANGDWLAQAHVWNVGN